MAGSVALLTQQGRRRRAGRSDPWVSTGRSHEALARGRSASQRSPAFHAPGGLKRRGYDGDT